MHLISHFPVTYCHLWSCVLFNSERLFYYLGFNLNSKHPLVGNSDFRRAMAQIINKKKFIAEVLGGMASEAKGPVPAGMFVNPHLICPQYNFEGGKAAISRLSGKVPPIRIFARTDSSILLKLTDFIESNLKDSGLRFVIDRYDNYKKFTLDNVGKYDMFISRWIADGDDPYTFLQSLFNPKNDSNFCRYENSEFMRLMDQANVTINPEKKLKFLHESEQTVVKDTPLISIFYPQNAVVSAKGIRGVNLNTLSVLKYENLILDSK